MATEIDSRLERFRLDPTDGRAFVALARLLRQSGSADLLDEVLELRAHSASDDEEAARLWLALADVGWRSDPRRRGQALLRAVDRARSSATLLTSLEQILEGRGESEALAEVLLHMSEHAPQERARRTAAERLIRYARSDAERATGWERLGRLDAERAGEAARELLGLATKAPDLFGRAYELAVAAADEDLQQRALTAKLRHRPPERAAAHAREALRAAVLTAEHARNIDEAVSWLRQAWERSPSDAREILDTYLRITESAHTVGGDAHAFEWEVASAVGRWERAFIAAESAAASSTSAADRAGWEFNAAETLHGKLRRSDEAVAWYRSAAALDVRFEDAVERRLAEIAGSGDGSDGHLLEARVELHERKEDWEGAVALLCDAADGSTDIEAVRLLDRAANLLFARLLAPRRAFDVWMQAAQRAGDVETLRPLASAMSRVALDAEYGEEALTRLRPLLEARGLHAELVRAVRGRLDHEERPQVRCDLALDLAELLTERLDRGADAVAVLEEVVDDGAATDEVYDTLAGLLGQQGRWSDALHLTEREVAGQPSRQRAANLALRRATVLEHIDTDGAATLGAWAVAWHDFGSSDARTELVRRLAEPPGQQAIERWIDETARIDGAETAAAYAKSLGRALGLDTPYGLDLAMRAFALASPSDEELESLRAAVERDGRASHRRAVHAEVAQRAAPEDRRTSERALWEIAIAEGDAPHAVERLSAYVDAYPDDTDAREALLSLVRNDEPATWASQAEGWIRAGASASRALDLLRELAVVYGNELGRTDLAVDALRRLLVRSPEDLAAIATVRAVAESQGNLQLLHDVLVEGLDAMHDAATRTERHQQIVSLCLDEIQDEALAGPHQWAVAESSSASAAERRSAAEWLRRRLMTTDATDDAAHAFEIELQGMSDNAAAHAEDVLDQLLDEGAWPMCLALGQRAVATIEVPTGLLLDRAALAARRVGDAQAERALLGRWTDQIEPAIPLDRRARFAALGVLGAGADAPDESTCAAAIAVLREAPDHPDLWSAIEGSSETAQMALAVAVAEAAEGGRALRHAAAAISALSSEGVPFAEALWRELVASDRSDKLAFDRLDASLRARDDVSERRAFLQEHLGFVEDEEARLPLLRALSLLAEDEGERESNLRAIVRSDLTDLEARHELAALYRRQERYAELAEILEDLGEIEDEKSERLRALHALARIRQNQLEDAPGAAEVLLRVVALDPDDVATFERLAKLLRAQEKWDVLATVIEQIAERTESVDDRIERLRELGRLREQRLDDASGACEAFEKILALEPANLPVLEDLARLYAEQERWQDHLHALERLANNTNIRALQAEVFVGAARAMHTHLGRSAEAFDLLSRAFEALHPDDEQLGLAREAANAAELSVPLANLLRSVASREENNDRRVALELEIARVLDTTEEGGPVALGWLIEVFAVSPAPGAVLDAMEELAERRALRSRLVESYKLLASSHEKNDEVWWHAMSCSAEIACDEVERPDVAFDVYARAAERPALQERAEAKMQDLAAQHGLWEKHREWLESQADRAGDDSERRILQKARLEETELNDWEAAFETLMGALQESPESEGIRAELYRMAAQYDAWELVLKLYEVIQEDTPSAVRVRLLLEMARVQAEVLEQPTNAFTQTLRAWQLQMRDPAVRDLLAERALQAGRRVDLLAAWEWEARQHERLDEQEDALERAVNLAVELGQWERACVAWRTLLAMPGRTAEWMQRSEQACEEPAVRDALLATWGAAVEQIRDAGERETLLLRYAALAESPTRRAEVADLLGQEVTRQRRVRSLNEAWIHTLEELEDWPTLAVALEHYAAVVDEPTVRVSLDTRRAKLLLERLDRPEDAVALQRRALRLPGSDDQTRAAYVEMLGSLDRWDDLVEYHMDRASQSEGDERIQSYLSAAAIAEEFLSDPRRALRVVDAVLADHPTHREALEGRARALAGLQRWGDQVATLDTLGSQLEGHAAAQIFGQAADTYELQLFDGRNAIAWWQRAAAADPEWVRPHAETARLWLDAGDRDAAVAAQREAVRVAGTSSRGASKERADAYTTLAELLRTEDATQQTLEEVQRLLEEALQVDPTHAEARHAYERVLEDSGGLERLLILLDEEMQRAENDVERARVLCKRGAVFAFEAQREGDARKAIERAAQLAPHRLAPRALLADIAFSQQRWEEAEKLYAALLEAETLDPNDLLEPKKLIVGESTEAALLTLYRTRHAVCLEKVGRLDEAYDLYTEVHLDDPSYPPALAALARISVLRGNRAGAGIHVANFFRDATGAPPEMIGEMKLLAARIAEFEGRSSDAVRLYDEASALGGPVRRDVVERAAQAAMRSGNWSSVIPRLQQLVDLAETTEERANALVQLVEALRNDDDLDPETASRHLLQAVIFCDERSALLERATELTDELLTPDDAWPLLTQMLESVDSDFKRGRLHSARARSLQNARGRIDEEVAQEFGVALRHAPDDAQLLERAVAAWRATGNLTALRTTLQEAIDALPAGSDGARIGLLRALGTLAFDELDDLPSARDAFETLLVLSPSDVPAREYLLAVYESEGFEDDARAAEIAGELVEAGQLTSDLLRSLERLAYQSGNLDGVVQILEILRFADEAEPQEVELLAGLPARTPNLLSDLFTAGSVFARTCPDQHDVEAGRVIAAALASWRAHVARRTAAPGEPLTSGPVHDLFLQLAPIFACDARLAVDPDQERPTRLHVGEHLTLCVSPDLVAATEEEVVRHELARAMMLARPEFLVVEALPAFDAVAMFEVAFAPLCTDARTLDDSLRRATVRWEERLSGYVVPAGVQPRPREAWPSASTWREIALGTALRAGLVISGSPRVALQRAVAEFDLLHPSGVADLKEGASQKPAFGLLMSYLMSPAWLELRKQLGIAHGASDPTT